MKIQLVKDKNKKWFFRVRADNGKILCHSESYSTKAWAKNGMHSLIKGIRMHEFKLEEIN